MGLSLSRLHHAIFVVLVWEFLCQGCITPFLSCLYGSFFVKGASRHFCRACMGVSLSIVHHAIFVVLCCFILLFDPCREHSSIPTAHYRRRRAQRPSRTALLQRPGTGNAPVVASTPMERCPSTSTSSRSSIVPLKTW